MEINHNKCIDCKDKKPGCHSKCNHYKIIKLCIDNMSKKRQKEYDFYSFIMESKNKIIKINQKNRKIWR